jgi:hypothetical protein
MTEGPACDYPGCGEVGIIISRLSPEGYLVATGKRPTHFEKHTVGFTTATPTMMN